MLFVFTSRLWCDSFIPSPVSKVISASSPRLGLDFGLYQTFVSGWKREHGNKDYPNMIVYFDEVNLGTSKEKVTKNLRN